MIGPICNKLNVACQLFQLGIAEIRKGTMNRQVLLTFQRNHINGLFPAQLYKWIEF